MARGAPLCPSSNNILWRIHGFAMLKGHSSYNELHPALQKKPPERNSQPISPSWAALATVAVPVVSASSSLEASHGPDAKEQGLACPHQTGCVQNREDREHPLLITWQCWGRAGSWRPPGCGAVRWKLDRRSSRSNWREAWQREKSLWHGGQEPGCDPSQERAAGTVQFKGPSPYY